MAGLALGCLLFSAVRVSAASQCQGDCDASGEVSIDEVLTGINIALDKAPIEACRSDDFDGNGEVAVDELIGAIANALDGCADILETLRVPDTFTYRMTRKIDVVVTVRTANGDPFANAAVLITLDTTDRSTPLPLIARGATDAQGKFKTTVSVPAYYQAVHVAASAPGVPGDAMVPIRDGIAAYDFR